MCGVRARLKRGNKGGEGREKGGEREEEIVELGICLNEFLSVYG